MNLDIYFKETTEHYFIRLINTYKRRMAKANDKDYTHNEFVQYCEAIHETRYKASEREEIINALEHEYKVGKEFSPAIKVLRKVLHKEIDDTIDFVDITPDNKNPESKEPVTPKEPKIYFIDQYSDLELVRMFSEYKAYEKFREFLKSEKRDKQIQKKLVRLRIEEIVEKNTKDYTTARQVLAVQYLLQYYKPEFGISA